MTIQTRIVRDVPLVAHAHKGTPPDLVMRWNDAVTAAPRVDMVVHFHGWSASQLALDIAQEKLPISGLDLTDPHGNAAGRAAPTLCLLPRGHYAGNDPGRKPNAFDFPGLDAQNELKALIDAALTLLAGVVGGAPKALGRLILTAHSGGGAALLRLMATADPDEVHVFDALYADPASGKLDKLIAWAKRRIAADQAAGKPPGASALRILYLAGTDTEPGSTHVAHAIAAAFPAALQPYFRADRVRVGHELIAASYGWRLLANAGAKP